MLDLNTIAEFSRANCLAICGFLVPANIFATSLTMVLTALNRPFSQVWLAAGIASFFALVMVLHVYTWFSIGVVMFATYILLWLAICCMLTNVGAILFRKHYNKLPLLRV